MEYVRKGAVMSKSYWRAQDAKNSIPHKQGYSSLKVLSEEEAWRYFRDLILGIDYSNKLSSF